MRELREQPADTAWMKDARCDGMDPELWFPVSEAPQDGFAMGRLQLAKATCHSCPVEDECLVYAVRTGQRFGIWGGMASRERAFSARCKRLRQESGVA